MWPADQAQAQDFRLGPSLRPCLKGDPEIHKKASNTNGFLAFYVILGVPTAAAAALYFLEILSWNCFNFIF